MNAPSPNSAQTIVERAHISAQDAAPITVEVTRGGMVESVHRGIAVVVDAAGKVVHGWGDVERPVYPRSAIKPLQTLSVFESGAADALSLGEDEIALCCASHSGEPMHVDRVVPWLARLGLGVDDLECGRQMPSYQPAIEAMISAGKTPTRANNNCSGKHSGMLSTAVHLGLPTKGYTTREHPIQTRLWSLFEELCELDLSGAATGIDGCGIPVFGVPLRNLAHAMAKLADPTALPERYRAAAPRIILACAKHPKLIAGTDTFNSLVLAKTGTDCLLKTGAEGVYMATLPKLGLGVCLKIDDGAGRASTVLMAALLDRLGVISAESAEQLVQQTRPQLTNWAGTNVGEIRPGEAFTF